MNSKIKNIVFEANGFYQDCCETDIICFEEKDLEKFVELIIREIEESEYIDYMTVQTMLEYYGFIRGNK